MTVTYIMRELVEGYGNDPRITDLLDSVTFRIAPIMNPDGYLYTWSNQRFWRKNRRNNGNGTWGVDWNRNFDANWKLTEGVDPVLKIPSAFISGAADMVIAGADETGLRAMMGPQMSDLREITLIDKMGHWVQQEAPEETNAAVIRFIESL